MSYYYSENIFDLMDFLKSLKDFPRDPRNIFKKLLVLVNLDCQFGWTEKHRGVYISWVCL
jgi:hypothetical protein